MKEGTNANTPWLSIYQFPKEVFSLIFEKLDLNTLVRIRAVDSLWHNLVQDLGKNFIKQYFPYLETYHAAEIAADALKEYDRECRRYQREFPQIAIPLILAALSGNKDEIAKVEDTNNQKILYALFRANGHTLPEEIQEDKKEINAEAFKYAAGNGYLVSVQALLSQEKITSKRKGFALQYAAFCGQLHMVQFLLSLTEIPSGHIGLALQDAAYNGHREVVELLLPLAANQGDIGFALRQAAVRNHLEVVNLLLSKDIPSLDLSAALRNAACHDKVELIKLLFARKDFTPDAKGSALQFAAAGNNLNVVNYLLTLPSIPLDRKQNALMVAKSNSFDAIQSNLAKERAIARRSSRLKIAAIIGFIVLSFTLLYYAATVLKAAFAKPQHTPTPTGSDVENVTTETNKLEQLEIMLTPAEPPLANLDAQPKKALLTFLHSFRERPQETLSAPEPLEALNKTSLAF